MFDDADAGAAGTITVTLHDQPESVLLDFMYPIGVRRDGCSARRDARYIG
jgi:hypothetical protein